ncbi:hypothetical protein KGQ20_36735 [Catenulispora sp. NF23]|uniref:SsuA/THI5-like domain-containing protein n=1 Tax=Catenulispora pinistramenti TaxID=2705254 RepID=A0ABS5L641_9ACTN|nr:hypothetical protein [Catenulispora pinistramenti]MBS2538313.1 hypothetical protein [Catenulispora pinistramenti]MBS2553803.1 hypothetical protein [Catenulispora pinistramenti]
MGDVPALDPLSYPGRVIGEPAVLSGARVLELTASAEPMGSWRVQGADFLDAVLEQLGQPQTGKLHPVIAIGSNAAPAQLHYKLTRLALPSVVPMTPLTVSGLGIGVSAHVALNGYVANSPFADPGLSRVAQAQVVLTLLDAEQLRAVDDTELPRYRRVLLSGDEYPMVLPSGERLEAAYLYANAAGVLAGEDGKPLTPTTQPTLLAALLERSARLRELFDSPQDWVDKARADPQLRAAAKRIFVESGWVVPQDALLRNECDPATAALTYNDVSPLATGREPP